MKAIFAITSHGNDFYTAMTRVAVASLRLTNPNMRLVVACDAESDDTMKRQRDPLTDEVDEWLVIRTPPGNDGFRNRFVKTSLSSVVNGPFLFLDSDIFVRDDLSEIFSLDCDIAGARNHSRMRFSEQIWEQDQATLDAMGWSIRNKVYINGGVVFYNDTEGARTFGAEWHRRWLKSFEERGNYRDQPALNSALHYTQAFLTVLDDRFNAQFKVTPSVAESPAIWHYYSSAADVELTNFERLANSLTKGATLNQKIIKKIAQSTFPWRNSSPVDNIAARRLVSRNTFDGWEAAWLKRDFSSYTLQFLKDSLTRR